MILIFGLKLLNNHCGGYLFPAKVKAFVSYTSVYADYSLFC